jgi:hypothetical protein
MSTEKRDRDLEVPFTIRKINQEMPDTGDDKETPDQGPDDDDPDDDDDEEEGEEESDEADEPPDPTLER